MFPALFYVHRGRKHTKSCVIQRLIMEEFRQTIKSKQGCVVCWKRGDEGSDSWKYHQRPEISYLCLGSASWRRENRAQFEEAVVTGRKTQSGNRVHEKNRTFLEFFFVLFLIANKKKRRSDPPGLLHSNVSTCFVFWEFLTDAYFLPPYPGVGSFSFLANAVVTASSELNLCIYLYGPNPVARFSTPRLGVSVYFNHST